MNQEETYLNEPHAKLAHLGCAALILLAALVGSLTPSFSEFQLWLQEHPCTMPLLFLGLLAAAYLLEHALTTAAMLALLAGSILCAGFSLGSWLSPAFTWLLLAGPLGYFLTVPLALHCWAGRLYRWQFCGIFLTGALLLPGLLGFLMQADAVSTICALNTGLITAIIELSVFYGRDYFELTSTSRMRSTVISMVMLLAVPVYKILWLALRGCYYGSSSIFRIFRWW